MASWVLIGFLNTSRSHLHNRTFVHSLVLPLALKFYPPPDRNFCRRQIFHLDLSFSAFIFLTSRNFGFVNRLDFTKYTGAAGQWSHNSSGADQNTIAMEQNLKTHDLGWKGANAKILKKNTDNVCVLTGVQFEETFKDAQWGKVKQMQPT